MVGGGRICLGGRNWDDLASLALVVVGALDRHEIGDPVWRQPARRATCLFSVRALSEVFKAKFMQAL